ncbi:MAG: polymer-forming cytoskeletal protein [Rickettsiales bacterium]|jgi:cytoskeletal protein CcmA (bactofilin family)|nr:polymer-forming cytoskeletal protein [Rickettsiales bacterium]
MFSRRKSKANKNLPAISTAPSIIVSDLNISGDLVSQGSIEIGGKVKGNVKCNNVVIRKESKVNGDIYADNLVIKGVVKGVVNADNVIVDETGIFEGQINYKNLTTSPGASVNGILNKVNKAKEEVITEDEQLNENDSTASSVNDNLDEDFEYIPSISTLIDNTDNDKQSEVSNIKNKDSDIEDSETILDLDGLNSESSASVYDVESLKGIKATKKSSILDDDAFDFIPPTNKKNKYKKKS